MFVGHYAASLALKSFERRASLGMLFLGVQLVDIIFFPLVLLGIERINIIENYTESTHFQLEYMPFTHSLAGSLFWAVLVYALFRWVIVKKQGVALALNLRFFPPVVYRKFRDTERVSGFPDVIRNQVDNILGVIHFRTSSSSQQHSALTPK